MCLRDVGKSVRLSRTLKDAILNQHNLYRSRVSPTASNMQVMVWDDSLAEIAAKWGRQCRRGHDKKEDRVSPDLPGVYIGQNAAYGYRNWQTAIEAWHDEVSDFKFGQGSLTGEVVGHYTQLVAWRSARVGCGQADCPSSPYRRHFVCNYAQGQVNDDPKTPYRQGDRCADCLDRCDEKGNMCDCGGKVCFNGGKINLDTCKCKCPDIYTGDVCQTLQCPAEDAWYCGSQWPEVYCQRFTNVPQECPFMCNVCSSLSAGKPAPVRECRLRCKNGGKVHPVQCACVCHEGFEGVHCERKAPGGRGRVCGGRTCLNGGQLDTRSCRCDCPFGHTGERCETKVKVCGGRVCKNRGRLNTATCQCECPRPFTGDHCQHKTTTTTAERCPGMLCQNGGRLVTSTCSCQCPDEFRGPRCEKRKCGAHVTCHNGGKLNYTDCSCRCAEGYYGKRCKKKAQQSPDSDIRCDKSCQNGGLLDPVTCRCWCPSPYVGDLCQTVDCPEEDHKACGNFPDTYCLGLFLMRHMCPYKCALCAPKDCGPDKWFCNENYIKPHLCSAVGNYCPSFCGLC
ncbi:uncharacterized protein LOC143294728 [Babylonia areolata]|uniref:uncharacterized protein LOC143294728 n=1 Tax=Babylonia areolata TaxID=304850 RepID=UPI003FD58BA7